MNPSAKLLIKIFSIGVLSLMVVRGFNKSASRNMAVSIKYSIETSFLVPIIIYLLNS